MTYYFRQGNSYFQTPTAAQLTIENKLPAGTYTIKFDQIKGQYYFEIVENFTLPSKQYGDLNKNTVRIINTFKDRSGSTGVLLAGEKGSGKTLLGKKISVELIGQEIPTVIINTNHHGEAFNTFIQQMEQEAVIFFDEFEKIYNAEEQEQILTLLDGVYPTKKLFIITANDKWRIDQHMRNRPGRIFYALDFEGLSTEFVTEYATENLKNKAQVGSVVNVSTLFPHFNFDMLKALVEEMNRYDETAQEAIKLLNTKPENSGRQQFDITLFENGVEVPSSKLDDDEWEGNPLANTIHIYVDAAATPKAKAIQAALEAPGMSKALKKKCEEMLAKEIDECDNTLTFCNDNLVKMDGSKGTFHYEKTEEGVNYTLILTKLVKPAYNYTALL